MLKEKEVEVKKKIIDYLRLKGWRVYRIYNGAVPMIKKKKIIWRKQPKEYRGVPDLFAMKKNFPMLWLEVKGKGGRLRKEQEEFIKLARLTSNGWAHVVWSLEEVIEIIKVLEDNYNFK